MRQDTAALALAAGLPLPAAPRLLGDLARSFARGFARRFSGALFLAPARALFLGALARRRRRRSLPRWRRAARARPARGPARRFAAHLVLSLHAAQAEIA